MSIIKWIGSKQHACDIINDLISNLDINNYIEPFIGSGAIFLNKEKMTSNWINDLNPHLIKIWNSIKYCNYEKVIELKNQIEIQFGDIKKSKESFYNFRNWFNTTHLNTYTLEEGIYLLFLANSCINSIFRFGPKGFNSSFGNRFLLPTELNYTIGNKLLQNTKITNLDWYDCINDTNDTLIFLDPPYVMNQNTAYIQQMNNDKHIDFLNKITEIKNSKVIYSDTLNDINSNILKNWNIKKIDEKKKLRNIAPSKSSEIVGIEVIFYNF